jgi:anti-sigma regulatory factor (Ser/Thr protein kinase)
VVHACHREVPRSRGGPDPARSYAWPQETRPRGEKHLASSGIVYQDDVEREAIMSRVLLIGNHPEIRRGLETLPALSQCEIVGANGNVDAVRTVRSRAIEVVLTDPDTPMHDDLALVAELHATRPGLKTILLAPTAAPGEMIEALRAQVFACFVAPFDLEAVGEMTRRAIDAGDWRDGIRLESGLPNWIALTVSCRLITAERLVHFMTEYRRDLPEDDRDNLMTAFREMLMNAMEHGAGFDPENVVKVIAVRTERAIVYHFRDPGPGFTRQQLEHHALPDNGADPIAHIERRADMGLRPGGFGILVAKKLVDEMYYNERGNEVLLIKRLA